MAGNKRAFENVEMSVKDNVLTIQIDLDPSRVETHISNKGKGNSDVFATTEGFTTIPGTNMRIGLNVIQRRR